MRVVTFAGNMTYIEEVIRKDKVTDVYIDKSYAYIASSKWDNVQDSYLPVDTVFLDSSDIKKITNKFTSYGIRVVVTDTNIPYDAIGARGVTINIGNVKEVVNRRIRITKMLNVILSEIDDDILFVDSDVLLNDDVFTKIPTTYDEVVSICIPALAKPSTSYVFTFCYSTNFYLPSKLHDTLSNALKQYVERRIYELYPVDLYIHRILNTKNVILVKGVCHYIRGKLYCT
jgi:hypothetical protein